jgi:ParB family chromosome partitioning protein
MGHAISLLSLQSKTQMLAIADRIKKKKLSVRNTEEIVSKINQSPTKKIFRVKPKEIKALNLLESKLIHKYGTKVSISTNKAKKGRIVLEYYSKDDLNRILDILINES